MRIFGIILLVAGAILLVLGLIDYTTDETLMKLGPLEVKAEDKSIGWPVIAGAIAFIAGIILVAVKGKH